MNLKPHIYEIVEKHTINDDDMSYFKSEDNEKILTLITCKNNGNKRLIVVAKLRKVKKWEDIIQNSFFIFQKNWKRS